MSVESDGAGDMSDHSAPTPDLPCLFDPNWPDVPPPVVSAGSEMDW